MKFRRDFTIPIQCVNSTCSLCSSVIISSILTMLFMLLQDHLKHDSVYRLHHIYYSAKPVLNIYKYIIMLFKLINAFTTFQTYINNVLREHLNMFVIIYLNNILIYSKNEKDYKKHIRQIQNTLKKVNLKIVSEKSKFYQTEIEFLEYIIINYRIKINLKKIRIIIE